MHPVSWQVAGGGKTSRTKIMTDVMFRVRHRLLDVIMELQRFQSEKMGNLLE